MIVYVMSAIIVGTAYLSLSTAAVVSTIYHESLRQKTFLVFVDFHVTVKLPA